MKDVRDQVGAALKECRARQRLTQEQLAERSGLSYKFIGEIERGRGNPTIATVARLADALGINIATLFAESDHHRFADEYQISKRDLQMVREALQSIAHITESLGSPSYPRARRRRT